MWQGGELKGSIQDAKRTLTQSMPIGIEFTTICMKVLFFISCLNFRGKCQGQLKILTMRVLGNLDSNGTVTQLLQLHSSGRHNLCHYSADFTMSPTLLWVHTNICHFPHCWSFTINHKAKERTFQFWCTGWSEEALKFLTILALLGY